MSKYILQKSCEDPLYWVLTDTYNGLVCKFKEGEFNETQKFTLLDDVTLEAPELAGIANEMSSYLRENHYELIFTSPQIIKENMRLAIGQRIKEAREDKGFTLRHLAKLTGIAFNHIGRIERGKYNVTIDTLAVLCHALDLKLC